MTVAALPRLMPMPPPDDRTWQEFAAANRERITALEHELGRVRDSLHDLRTEAAAIKYLAEQTAELAGDVRRLARRVEQIARVAVRRPSPTILSLTAQYIALAVSLAAVVIAARH